MLTSGRRKQNPQQQTASTVNAAVAGLPTLGRQVWSPFVGVVAGTRVVGPRGFRHLNWEPLGETPDEGKGATSRSALKALRIISKARISHEEQSPDSNQPKPFDPSLPPLLSFLPVRPDSAISSSAFAILDATTQSSMLRPAGEARPMTAPGDIDDLNGGIWKSPLECMGDVKEPEKAKTEVTVLKLRVRDGQSASTIFMAVTGGISLEYEGVDLVAGTGGREV